MTSNQQTKDRRVPNHRLKVQRLRKNWTQVYVATMIGTSDVEVSRWETGAAAPTLYFREQLCKLFGTTAEELGFTSSAETVHETHEQVGSLWNIPYRRNPFFTGREEVLARIAVLFGIRKATAVTQAIAISGLGGVGKTQIAIEYVYRHRDEYQAVFWVKADTQENLLSDMSALAGLLNLSGKEDRDQGRMVEDVKRWLKTHTNWLLILDNVEDLAQISDILALETGRLLLTLRSQVTGTLAQRLDLGKMEAEEGTLFLLRRAKRLPIDAGLEGVNAADLASATELTKMLDGLPLALDQAGAYIEEAGCNLSDYQERYQQQRSALLARRGRMGADHPHSVMTTLTMACIRVEQTNPAALALLRLCAFLHPDAIPEELLIDGASVLGPVLQPVVEDPLSLDAALATLRHYSLLQRNPGDKTLTIHRLVQAVLKDRMSEAEQRQWAERVVRMITMAVPPINDITGRTEWERSKQYSPHALVAVSLIETWKLHSREAERLLYWMGGYLNILGQYTQAESLLQYTVNLAIQSRGSEDLYVAEYINELAVGYLYQGKYSQAEQLLRDALSIFTRTLGSDHLSVAMCLNDLGALYIRQSRYRQNSGQSQYTQAEPLLQRSLTMEEKILGNEHPKIAFPLTNLGLLYYQLGNYAQAEVLIQRALHIREKALGANHFLVGYDLMLLGITYREQGRHAQAEPLLKRALEIREEALGVEHPVVAQSLHELAVLYVHQNRYEEAASLFQRALAIRKERLEKEHPDIVATSNAYADLMRKMQK